MPEGYARRQSKRLDHGFVSLMVGRSKRFETSKKASNKIIRFIRSAGVHDPKMARDWYYCAVFRSSAIAKTNCGRSTGASARIWARHGIRMLRVK